MSSAHDLVVRRTQRHDVVLRGRFSVSAPHTSIVRLGKASGVRDGSVEADVVDLSGGGIGFLSPVFFPKRLLVDVQVLGRDELAALMDEQDVLVSF